MFKTLLNINSTLVVFAVLFLILKVVFIFLSGPLPDEAYYWLWSKQPELSFYDHPPLTSWLQYLLSFVIPYNILQIRALPFLCFLLILSINIRWMKEIQEAENIEVLKGSVIFLSIPLYGIFLTIAFPDALMILCLFSSGFLFYKFYSTILQGHTNYKYWYLSTFCFSLACMTKYNAIVFGVGILVFIWSRKSALRQIFWSRHLVFAIFIFLFSQIPVLVWNLEYQFTSFEFHLDKRLDKELSLFGFIKNITTFILATAFSLSPLAIFKLYIMRGKKLINEANEYAISCAYYVLIVTIIFCIILSLFTNVLYYWSVVGFVLFLPFLSMLFRRTWELIFQLFYGFFFLFLLTINSAFIPITIFFGNVDRETAIIHEWEKVVEQISNFKHKFQINYILFTDYRIASLYSFHAKDQNVDTVMRDRETQFDIWRSQRKFYPENSLIISDDDFPIHERLKPLFKEIEYLGQIQTTRYNRNLKDFKVYLAKRQN